MHLMAQGTKKDAKQKKSLGITEAFLYKQYEIFYLILLAPGNEYICHVFGVNLTISVKVVLSKLGFCRCIVCFAEVRNYSGEVIHVDCVVLNNIACEEVCAVYALKFSQ